MVGLGVLVLLGLDFMMKELTINSVMRIQNNFLVPGAQYITEVVIVIIDNMDQYKLESKKGDGAFSEVFKARSSNGKYVAIKCMKKKFESIDKVRRLKEIQALRQLSPHENIIKLIEVLYDEPTGKLALVFELMEQNLYECFKSRKLSLIKIKQYMYQLLKAIDYIHRKGIFHRDIKPENILLLNQQIKLADFGSCKGMYKSQPYTQYISTRWYRAPECLMTDGYYDSKMDIWGYGCVLFEVISKKPLFPGKSEADQVAKINTVLGTPKLELVQRFKKYAQGITTTLDFPYKRGCGIERMYPDMPNDALDLLAKLLAYDPLERITAEQALKHQFFQQIVERKNKIFLSTFAEVPRSRREDSESNDSHHHKKDVSYGRFPQKKPLPHHRQTIEQEGAVQFPPIHSVGLQFKLNIYGHSTAKGDFKKPGLTSVMHTVIKNQNSQNKQFYGITGKKAFG